MPASLLLVSAAAAATLLSPSPDERNFQWDPVVDGAVTFGGGATYLILNYLVEPSLPPVSSAQGSVPFVDEVALDRWNPTAALASDVGLYGTLGLGLVASTVGGLRSGDGLVATGVVTESAMVTGAFTSLLKHAVNRPRPYTWLEDPPEEVLEDMEGVDAWLSFPSGHTSLTSAVSFATASVLAREGGPPVPLYVGAAVLTTSVASLRVVAGKHFPTDVVAGAAIGTAVGLAVPALHAVPADKGVSLWLGETDEGGLVGLRGSW